MGHINIKRKMQDLVAQTVKNLPVIQKSWDRSLGCEDPLEKGMATHSMGRGASQDTVYGVTERQT